MYEHTSDGIGCVPLSQSQEGKVGNEEDDDGAARRERQLREDLTISRSRKVRGKGREGARGGEIEEIETVGWKTEWKSQMEWRPQ
jgi:hypothetical protein